MIRKTSEWRTEHRCVSCETRLSTDAVFYSGGRCPACGYMGKSAGTIVDTTEHGYRLVRTGSWWQFWIPPKRQYLDSKN